MKVQEVRTERGTRWIVLDSAYQPVQLINKYIKFLDNIGRSQNTLLTYSRHLCTYGSFLEARGISITDIACQHDAGPLDVLADFLLWLEHPDILSGRGITIIDDVPNARKPSTINLIMNTVLNFYDYLARDRIVDPLAVYREGIDPSRFKSFLYEMVLKKHTIQRSLFHMREMKKELEYVTPELYVRILSECKSWRDKSIVGIMYEGGLRLGETLGLYLTDLEIWNNKINVVPREGNINNTHVKRKAAGSVFLPCEVFEMISAYCVQERLDSSSAYLFINLHGPNIGKPLHPDTIEKLFQRISKRLDISVHPHMCRHGCATTRLEAGWDELCIKQQLRHASLSSTRIYEHFKDDLLKEKSRDLYEKRQLKFDWNTTGKKD